MRFFRSLGEILSGPSTCRQNGTELTGSSRSNKGTRPSSSGRASSVHRIALGLNHRYNAHRDSRREKGSDEYQNDQQAQHWSTLPLLFPMLSRRNVRRNQHQQLTARCVRHPVPKQPGRQSRYLTGFADASD